jgi:hypothetical protein
MITFHIGMTGTREGMTAAQKLTFAKIIGQSMKNTKVFHHGDCLGADADGHDMAVELGIETHVHPPIKTEVRAYKEGTYMAEPDGYFARNRDIVNASDLMVATPVTDFETKGGTWYTINYAKKMNKPLIIISPDGTTV